MRREDVLGTNGSNIGRPLPDLECLLTDPAGNLVPYGVRERSALAVTGWPMGTWASRS
ncbi:peptide synthetase Nrp domain protein [Mycobacterium ulcerans str. Harvey]|uniref:Peptide synthetase Nrp domain protein n=1 Tax=Mycobacterium ulcerans str. Harvey TaxID=1299332 RepID=A0ABP3APD3_MYCUL|nr:peptide synthetase Nrp domain protein [Mycobacterium ulcerans str. Harvey]